MIKTTEELKREMYNTLNDVKEDFCIRFKITKFPALDDFESALEAYLEALRREAEVLKAQAGKPLDINSILHDAYMNQFAANQKLAEERDTERNRAQAFEYANKSAGEFLQEARTKIKAQRQSIGQLKNERDNAVHTLRVKESKLQKALEELSELRKSVSATRIQDSGENAPKAKSAASGSGMSCSFEGLHRHYIGACPHCGAVAL